MSQRRALISGVAGHEGPYLAEFPPAKAYEAHGTGRRVALEDKNRLSRLEAVSGQLNLHAEKVMPGGEGHA